MDPVTIVTAVIGLINAAGPYLGDVALVGKIVDSLEAIIPMVVAAGGNLVTITKDAIATLMAGNVAISEADLTRLEQFSAALDAAYDKSDAAATAEEQAAAGGATTAPKPAT